MNIFKRMPARIRQRVNKNLLIVIDSYEILNLQSTNVFKGAMRHKQLMNDLNTHHNKITLKNNIYQYDLGDGENLSNLIMSYV